MSIHNDKTGILMLNRICFITMDITLKGGIERVVCNLSNQLVRKNVVEVISIFRSNSAIYYDLNGDVKVTYLSDYMFKYSTYKLLLLFILFRSRSHFKNSISIRYIGLYPIINIFLIFFLRLRPDSLIASEHSEYFSQSWLLRILRAHAYRRILQVVVLTESGRMCFEKIGISAHVIPNMVSDFNNCLQWTSKGELSGAIECLFAGRFEPVKQVDQIIELASILTRSSSIDVHFNLLGEGILYQNMINLTRQEFLENVTFWGNVKNIDKHYIENQILLITSSTEAFPMVVIEAMSFGCVVIGYDSQVGTKEIVVDGVNGFIVPKNNIKALAEKLQYLYSNPHKIVELSKNALITSRSFKNEFISEKWNLLINPL
jgi:glycosyltransferase involved in cell wall biosynthesis